MLRLRLYGLLLFCISFFLFFSCRLTYAGTPPAGFTDTQLVSANPSIGVAGPTGADYEPGTNNLFVMEKGDGSSSGSARVRVRLASTGVVNTALTLSCVDSRGERGLLGIAFSPDYLDPGDQDRFVYLFYTRRFQSSGACSEMGESPGTQIRVSRFTESGGSLFNEEVILAGPFLNAATNHNGGSIRFASDKTLYIAIGDNDTDANPNPLSRNLSDLRGKILRINADGTIPQDNPFVNVQGARGEIWASGLRNPFRFSIDPDSDTPFIADVGENTWEAVYAGVPGADYGYPCFEGSNPFRSCNPNPAAGSVTLPVYEYGQGNQTLPVTGDSITGGPVYRGSNFPDEYTGNYFFADFGDGWIRRGRITENNQLANIELFMPDAGGVVDMVVSPSGCLTYVGISGEGVRDVCYVGGGNGQPQAVATASPTSGQAPLNVQFTSAGSSDPDNDTLDFDWDFGDGFSSSDENPSHGYTFNGVFDANLSVDDQQSATNSTDNAPPVRIVVGNRSPAASITAPTVGTNYNAGDTINFSGNATDPEETLDADDLSWTIAFHHDDHIHPFLGPVSGIPLGSFEIPMTGEDATNVFFRVHLTATDSGSPLSSDAALSSSQFVDVIPNISQITLATNPPDVGLVLEYDQSQAVVPFARNSIVNFPRTIGAPSPQFTSGRTFVFSSWSDAGSAEHGIFTPTGNPTFTATYQCTTNCDCVEDLILSNALITDTETFDSCESIFAGPSWVVDITADVTFLTSSVIRLQPGFSVRSGGQFRAQFY